MVLYCLRPCQLRQGRSSYKGFIRSGLHRLNMGGLNCRLQKKKVTWKSDRGQNQSNVNKDGNNGYSWSCGMWTRAQGRRTGHSGGSGWLPVYNRWLLQTATPETANNNITQVKQQINPRNYFDPCNGEACSLRCYRSFQPNRQGILDFRHLIFRESKISSFRVR